MQAAPAHSPPSEPELMNNTDNEKLPTENDLEPKEDRRRLENVANPQREAETGASTPVPTALPGIRDLFPDHLFEAQQRLDPVADTRPKDPFFFQAGSFKRQAQIPSEADRELQREAFAAITATSPSRMQPRSPYTERGAFTFPGPSASTRAPLPPQPPPALTLANQSVVPPPLASSMPASGRVPVPSTIATSNASSSSQVAMSEPTRMRRGHAHTYSSDASAAAAGLLGLSLSGGPPSNAPPHVATNGALERRANGKVPDETEGNSIESTLASEMDGIPGQAKRKRVTSTIERDEEMEMEGVETAETSVDSHASSDAKQEQNLNEDIPVEELKSSPRFKGESSTKEQGEGASSVENGNVGEREPTSSAENELGEGEMEGDGDGGDGKRHTCPHCKKRFNRPSSLKIHLNTHTGAKPFECPFPGCGRQFNVSSNMRRHYRNHSSPAAPGLGMGLAMGIHEAFGPRPHPHGMLGLHPSHQGYSNAQIAQVQMQREMERERLHRERMLMQGHGREGHPQYGPPSAYRPPPHAAGVALPPSQGTRIPPSPSAHPGVAYPSYPPGFGPHRDADMERRERLARLERENWEREHLGRLERRVPPSLAPQMHPAYPQHSPPQHERPLDYRSGGDPGRATSDQTHYQQASSRNIPLSHSHPNSQIPPLPQTHYSYVSQPHPQARPPVAGPTPVLRSSRSFSHPYGSPHMNTYPRSSPSHSHSRERYSSGTGSPVLSPALSAASSLPVQGWRGHAHTHSAPAFQGLGHRPIELPPLTTAIRSPYSRGAPLPPRHGRSQSYSSSSTQIDSGLPLPPLSDFARAMDGRDDEKGERRAGRERRDSTAALTGHESDREVMQGATSDFEGEEKREESDIDMRDVAGDRLSRMRPQSPSSATIVSPLQSISSTFQRTTPPTHATELRRRTSNPQAVPDPISSASRERGYSQSQPYYSHSRTGSGSSSGHGHGYTSHPYARARHAHSLSREAAAGPLDTVSPRLRASLSTSPRPSLPSLSASVSPRASISSVVSPGPIQKGVNADVRPLREHGNTDRGLKISSPSSISRHASRFPVYTFPPPVPPPGAMGSSASPVGSSAMEVEN